MSDWLPKKAARKKLAELLNLLDERQIEETILKPLDRAAATFPLENKADDAEAAPGPFLEAIGCFIKHIYAHGLRTKRDLSQTQAEAEAAFLLGQSYRGQHGTGYEAALLDCAGLGPEGLPYLRDFLLEAVKHSQRRKHRAWVRQALVETLDWEMKRALTRLAIDYLRAVLSEEVTGQPPERFVASLPELLQHCADVRAEFRRMVDRV